LFRVRFLRSLSLEGVILGSDEVLEVLLGFLAVVALGEFGEHGELNWI